VSLEKKLSEAKPLRRGAPCSMFTILAQLPARDRTALEKSLSCSRSDPTRLSNKQISEILKSEGHVISKETVQRHRVGDCNCEPRRET
jgi:hypothetical protein